MNFNEDNEFRDIVMVFFSPPTYGVWREIHDRSPERLYCSSAAGVDSRTGYTPSSRLGARPVF